MVEDFQCIGINCLTKNKKESSSLEETIGEGGLKGEVQEYWRPIPEKRCYNVIMMNHRVPNVMDRPPRHANKGPWRPYSASKSPSDMGKYGVF